MFSIIGQYIRPNKSRETDATDTHAYIRKHQRDDQKHKKQNQSDPDLFSTEDQANVSVDALHTFLENFLAEQINNNKEPELKNFLDNMESLTKRTPKKQNPVKNPAIHAYQHAAETSPDQQNKRVEHKNISEKDIIGNEDMQIIYALIKDLEYLQSYNVETLTIQRADTFLESLRISIQTAKFQISSV